MLTKHYSIQTVLTCVSEKTTFVCMHTHPNTNMYTCRADTGTDYDVIDHSVPCPPTTHPVPTSDQDYSTLDTDEQEHDYHVLESTNAGGTTAVGGQEHDYHVLESTNAGSI